MGRRRLSVSPWEGTERLASTVTGSRQDPTQTWLNPHVYTMFSFPYAWSSDTGKDTRWLCRCSQRLPEVLDFDFKWKSAGVCCFYKHLILLQNVYCVECLIICLWFFYISDIVDLFLPLFIIKLTQQYLKSTFMSGWAKPFNIASHLSRFPPKQDLCCCPWYSLQMVIWGSKKNTNSFSHSFFDRCSSPWVQG